MTCPYLPQPLNSSIGYQDFIEKAYTIFKNDLVYTPLKFNHKSISINHNIQYQGKEQSFWHIVSKDSGNNCEREREIDQDRAARIPWIKPLIELNCQCNSYKVWKKFHAKTNKYRWLIWCTQENYVIVLEDRKSCYKLITAYIVDHQSYRNKFNKEYTRYIQEKTETSPNPVTGQPKSGT